MQTYVFKIKVVLTRDTDVIRVPFLTMASQKN
jgi:hypothetical protein